MEISVDGERLEIGAGATTIAAVISAARARLLQQGRLVMAVAVDGEPVDADGEAALAERPAASVQSMAFETTDAKALCLATLDEVARHIQPIVDEGARIGALVDSGKSQQAFDRMMPCLEVWGAILSAMQKVAVLMDVDMGKISAGGESLPENVKSVIEFLQEIRGGIESRDFVAIRDALKHRMPEVAAGVAAQVEALTAAVAAR